MKPITDLKKYHEIEQFYFQEARMLDERKYQSWMELLAADVEYTLPNRSNQMLDVKLKNREQILSLDNEFSKGLEPPLRQDNMITLSLRANRPTNPSAWAENPPARTRRHVSNVEAYREGRRQYKIYNNVLMTYSRHDRDNHLYSYQREDTLLETKGMLKIFKRKVVLDWNVITAPTVALIF